VQLIVLSRRRRIQRALHIGSPATALLGIAGCALLAGVFVLGARVAGEPPAADPRPDLYAAAMHKELASHAARVGEAVGAARRDLDALALRLSDLQARTIRLDALGARLVELAGLEASEFSFGEPPARGGTAPQAGAEPNRVEDFLDTLAELERTLDLRAQELAALEASLISGRLAEQVTPSGSPVVRGWISSGFGPRIDPLTGGRGMHHGVDFAGPRGSPIRAVAAGIVVFAGVRSGLGRVVEIDHGKGYVTRYAHNLENLVKVGQRVARGEHVARMGSSGRSTGNHVHFEVLYQGRPLNPMTFIRAAERSS